MAKKPFTSLSVKIFKYSDIIMLIIMTIFYQIKVKTTTKKHGNFY